MKNVMMHSMIKKFKHRVYVFDISKENDPDGK